VPAVRKYFDPTLTTFPHRRIAKEALLAGNDLLLLSQFDLDNVWANQFANIRDTVAFFRDEYRANPTFAARIDEAVAKILRLKLALYPEFSLEAAQVHADAATQVCGLGGAVTQRIANQALTLLYPDTNALPAPPRRGEKLLIFTDARPVRECFTDQCQPFTPLSQTAVEEAILRSYGPQGTGQIDAEDITSLPFGQLKLFLSGSETQYDVGTLLAGADWVIFAPQDLNPVKGPNSDAVELFLNDARSAAYDARYVVLAFNAPYYLDTTEISKLSLYLAAYSKVDASIEAAVRALFGELMPRGASPVDVTGINYDLRRQLAPDPDQTIPQAQLAPAPDALLLPPLSVHLQAGPVLDHNGHVVPDGTQVAFYAEYDNGTYAPPRTATTTDGLAEASLSLTAAGQVRFHAESGEATHSETVSLLVEALPTAMPTATSPPAPGPPTATPTSTTSAEPGPSPTPTSTPGPPPIGSTHPVDGADLLLAASATALAALAGLALLGRRRRATVVRWLALAISGGMAGYLLYALQVIRPETWGLLPDSAWVARVAVGLLAAVGALLPLVAVARMREP